MRCHVKPLDEIMKDQKDSQASTGNNWEQRSGTEHFFLHFSIGKSQFLLPLSDVQEVCEFTRPRPYPVPTIGYLGAINLRGNVVPVMSMAAHLETPLQEQVLLKNTDRQNRLILVR